MIMKKRIHFISVIALALTFFACNNNKYNFIGDWKYCSATDNKVWCTISQNGNDFIIKGSTKNLVLQRKSDVLLQNDSIKITVRYEPVTNHLFISRDTSKGFELCRINK